MEFLKKLGINETNIPMPGAPWFDAAQALLNRAVDGQADLPRLRQHLAGLPPLTTATPPGPGATFWLEDWEVHELHFPTIHDLAKTGFRQMLAPRLTAEDA